MISQMYISAALQANETHSFESYRTTLIEQLVKMTMSSWFLPFSLLDKRKDPASKTKQTRGNLQLHPSDQSSDSLPILIYHPSFPSLSTSASQDQAKHSSILPGI